MSIQNYNEHNDKINITGNYDHSTRKIYFSFAHDTTFYENKYALYVNESEVDIKKHLYLKLDDSHVQKLEEHVDYYLNKDDFLISNIKIDIVVINRDIVLEGFGDHDGVYTYLYDGYYKNSTGAYFHKVYNDKVPHWELVDDDLDIKHITETSSHSTHPYGHSFKTMRNKPIIVGINIVSGKMIIEYSTDL